jgi:hypothetical protein
MSQIESTASRRWPLGIGETKPAFGIPQSMASLNFTRPGTVDLQFGVVGWGRSRFFGIAGVQF